MGWVWVDLAVASIIPFIIMTLCSIAIIGKIIYSNKQRRQLVAGADIKISSMTVTILMVNLQFLILTAPFIIMHNLTLHVFQNLPHSVAITLYTIFLILNVVLYLNSGIHNL